MTPPQYLLTQILPKHFLDYYMSFKYISGLKYITVFENGSYVDRIVKEFKTKQTVCIKWFTEPIDALGVYYTYDQTLLLEENFIE